MSISAIRFYPHRTSLSASIKTDCQLSHLNNSSLFPACSFANFAQTRGDTEVVNSPFRVKLSIRLTRVIPNLLLSLFNIHTYNQAIALMRKGFLTKRWKYFYSRKEWPRVFSLANETLSLSLLVLRVSSTDNAIIITHLTVKVSPVGADELSKR